MPSVDFIVDIFPDLATFAQTHIPFLWEQLFPNTTAVKCPTPHYSPVDGVTLAWPGLELACLCGMLVGLFGAFSHLSTAFGGNPKIGAWAWGMSCLFFGFMNPTAWMAHAYLRVTGTATPYYREMIYADVAWTGTSSAFLILACFVKAKFLDDRSVLFRAVTMVIPVAMVFGGVYLRQEGFGWVDEAEYIGTTIVAAAVAVWLLILTPDSGSQNTSEVLYLALVLLGGVIFPGGLALDRYMCDYFGTPYGNMLLPAFWGCGIAFVGLYLYSKSVVERQSVAEQVNGRKKRM